MDDKSSTLESVERVMFDRTFYKGKKVLITGHTGFKGSWLCRILIQCGADVTGYSLEPTTDPALFYMADLEKHMKSIIGDIRDFEKLKEVFKDTQPEIVFHLAAQPIVREGYNDPRYTYETNVMGTVNIMECIRLTPSVKSVVNVTTDKVYRNNEWCWGYRENECLDGFDPYSNSKSCSELVTHCYVNSLLENENVAISTARAGNVIGGGDFAKDRIIPDCVRAVSKNETIWVRNPASVRPYQHVLEPLSVYLLIAEKQYADREYAGCYNVGPDDADCVTTGKLVDMFCEYWDGNISWQYRRELNAPHEAGYLRLDCSKLKMKFGWKPTWTIADALKMTCQFSKKWLEGDKISAEMDREIEAFWGGEK